MSRLIKWAVGVVGAALLAWGAVDAGRWIIDRFKTTPQTVIEQQAEIVSEAAGRGYLVLDARNIDLQGTGQRSRLFVFRRQDRFGGWLASDELRIYDLRKNALRLRLTFRPRRVEGGRFVSFDIAAVRKIGERQVVLGAFHEIAMGPCLSIPVVLDWDAVRDRYRIKPLLSPRRGDPLVMPHLLRLFKRGDYAEVSRADYLTPVSIEDAASASSFRSYTTEESLFVRDRLGDALLAAFIVKARAHADLPVLQVAWWRLDLLQPIPMRYLCLTEHPRLVKPRAYEGLAPAMVRAWTSVSRQGIC
jgi:hypothetical protein